MRKAEEILHSIAPHLNMDGSYFKLCIKAINEARIEAIKECAEVVETINTSKDPWNPHYEINKQSILSLLTSIK